MKIFKLIPILFIISFFNTSAYSFEEDCNSIKQNIVKKLACKAMNKSGGSSQSNSTTQNDSLVEGEEKTGILSKIWKKPNWMKKKN